MTGVHGNKKWVGYGACIRENKSHLHHEMFYHFMIQFPGFISVENGEAMVKKDSMIFSLAFEILLKQEE
jgi:hypothetical protein